MSSQTPVWFTRPRPNPGAALRLFCFPYAGGGASVFRSWWKDLPSTVEVCALQLPGRESRFVEPSCTSLPALIEAVTGAIRPWLDRPFVFFGHSMGGLISFELARALVRRGGPRPSALLLSARRPPGARSPARLRHTLSDAELQQELVDMNGMDPAVLADPELMSLLLGILRADFTLCETHTHVPGPRLPCPIIAFGGEQDRTVPAAQLADWAAETSAAHRLHVFPGDHFYFKHAWQDFARALSDELLPHITAALATPLRIGA